jgi:cathepsin D
LFISCTCLIWGLDKICNSISSGTNELINHNQDSSFFGSLAIGTPAQAYNVILDTGSADLWVASSSCSTGCNGITAFNSTTSSSFKNTTAPFDITYGSGRAQGILAQDTVQMAGFSVPNQNFGVVDAVSPGLLTTPVSGLLGLGFKTIASSHATPFWQTLVESGAWDQPVMSFYLSRFINATHAKPQEPGGRFTMGEYSQSMIVNRRY